MRNLKKVLSLTLALVMMLGMMTFAGAAETKLTAADFKDMDKVANKEAVTLLVDLGILNGVKAADGTYTFNPAGNIERGAYAKMVYAVKLATDKADVYKGANTGLTDVKGHWAEGYIAYCVSTKIAAGNPDKTFTPNANISVVAAAKMLLTALGYDAKLSKYENDPLWAINIMADAQSAGLMDGVNLGADAVLTRDAAAQMIFNALFAEQVRPVIDRDQGIAYLVKYENKYTGGGAKNKLGEFVFDLHTVVGNVTANTFGKVAGADAAKDKTFIDITDAGDSGLADGNFALASTAAQLGHQVKFFTKANGTLISTAVVDSGKTKTYTVSEKHADFVKDNGLVLTKSDLTKTAVITDYAGTADVYAGTLTGDVLLINADGSADKSIEYVVLSTFTFSNVTDVNATKGTIRIKGLPVMETKNVVGAEGLVKGDYVIYNKVGSTYHVEKAPSITGKLESYKLAKLTATISGTTYDVADDNTLTADLVENGQEAYDYIFTADLKKATEATYYMNKLGAVIVYVGTDAAVAPAQYALITALKNSTDAWDGSKTVEAKIVLADGTQTTVNVVDVATGTGITADDYKIYLTNSVYDVAVYFAAEATTKLAGKVYAYTVDKDGNYKFTLTDAQVGAVELDGTDKTDWKIKASTGIADITGQAAGVKVLGCTAAGTNSHTVGKAELVEGKAYADAKTIALFVDGVGKDAKYTSYTGVDKIPGFKSTTITYVPGTDSLYTPFILVSAAPKGVASDLKYAYGLAGQSDYTTVAGGYAYDFVVDGAKVSLTVAKQDEVDTNANVIYSYTITDGIADLTKVATTGVADGNMNKGVITTVAPNYIIVDISSTTTADNRMFYTGDAVVSDLTSFKDGKVVPAVGAFSKGDTIRFTLKVDADGSYISAAYVVPGAFNATATGNKLTATGKKVVGDVNTDYTVTASTSVALDACYKLKYVWTDSVAEDEATVTGNTYNPLKENVVTCTVTVVSALDGTPCSTTADLHTEVKVVLETEGWVVPS